MTDPASRIVQLACAATFDRPLVTNIFRGIVVEAIVSLALPEWRWVSSDYSPFDFQHPDGCRLEVKQSSLRQSWYTAKPSRPSWDIAARSGTYAPDGRWLPNVARNADVYLLGLHSTTDNTADHRMPDQWSFFVVPERLLPGTKRIGLATIARLAGDPVPFVGLEQRVASVKASMTMRG